MTDFTKIDRVALTLIQVTGLLLPVVFLTVRFYVRETSSPLPEDEIEKARQMFKKMVLLLTATGITGTASILDLRIKELLAFLSVSSLILFFAYYGIFIFHITDSESSNGRR